MGRPSLEISMLAVDKEYIKRGVGRALLKHALFCCAQIRKYAGVEYLLVCSEPKAVNFYKHTLGFKDVGEYCSIPRDMWNGACVPLYIKLPET